MNPARSAIWRSWRAVSRRRADYLRKNRQAVSAQKRHKFGAHLIDDPDWNLGYKIGPASSPVEILDVVGQDYTRNSRRCGQNHLKRIALCFTRDRAHQGKPYFGIVGARRENESRAPASLLVPRLGIEFEPHEVAALWNVACPRSHQASPPLTGPQSTSSCKLLGVTPASSSSSERSFSTSPDHWSHWIVCSRG